jgi:hypothetical protein
VIWIDTEGEEDRDAGSEYVLIPRSGRAVGRCSASQDRLSQFGSGSFGPSSKFDEGPVVYRPPRQIAPPGTPRRGFGALRFDPRAQHPKRNAPLSAPKPPALSRSLFFSLGLVNRSVSSGGLMRTQLRSNAWPESKSHWARSSRAGADLLIV